MKDPISTTRWVGYGAAVALILLSLAAVFWASKRVRGPLAQVLPPIQNADVQSGFVGRQPFGLWLLICENVAPQPVAAQPQMKRLCRTNARVTVRGANNTALLAAGLNVVMTDQQKTPGLLLRLPPAAGAAASVNFAVDNNTMFKVPLTCTAKDCIAQGALPAEALEQMRQGRTLSILYTIKDRAQKERKVRVDQLLHGFRQSYDAMTRAMS